MDGPGQAEVTRRRGRGAGDFPGDVSQTLQGRELWQAGDQGGGVAQQQNKSRHEDTESFHYSPQSTRRTQRKTTQQDTAGGGCATRFIQQSVVSTQRSAKPKNLTTEAGRNARN